MTSSTPVLDRPTRIIEEPKKVYVNGVWTWQVVTDKGTFLAPALSHLLGFIHHHGFTQRLRMKHWTTPGILNPPAPKGFKISGEKMSAINHEEIGNAAWQALSDKPRGHKLKNIPALPGRLERQYLG